MKIYGRKVESRGIERVYVNGEEMRRTIYWEETSNGIRYYVKAYGEVYEAYHMSCYFTTNKEVYEKSYGKGATA